MDFQAKCAEIVNGFNRTQKSLLRNQLRLMESGVRPSDACEATHAAIMGAAVAAAAALIDNLLDSDSEADWDSDSETESDTDTGGAVAEGAAAAEAGAGAAPDARGAADAPGSPAETARKRLRFSSEEQSGPPASPQSSTASDDVSTARGPSPRRGRRRGCSEQCDV